MNRSAIVRLVPGVLLCLAITLVAMALQFAEEHLTGRPWLEALVIAILLGTAIRSVWSPGERWKPGIAFSAKTLLEVAVMLLGVSISFQTILAVGPSLLFAIVGIVAVAICASYAISRGLGLPQRMSLLVACGNSICGNSAIAAVAPVIGATAADVASSIAFTAVLGVVVVLTLPLLISLIGLSELQYGVLAGLTVYAVPQVLAATFPVSTVSTQIGTLVKLVRVLMLGPVVLALSIVAARLRDGSPASLADPRPGTAPVTKRAGLTQLVPWFIIGFLALAALRSIGLVPAAAAQPILTLTGLLTVVAMAALGLGVDLRVLAKAGGPVTLAVTASLVLLLALSLAMIRLLGIG